MKQPKRFCLRDSFGNVVLLGAFKYCEDRVRLVEKTVYYTEDPNNLDPPRVFNRIGIQEGVYVFVEVVGDLSLPA